MTDSLPKSEAPSIERVDQMAGGSPPARSVQSTSRRRLAHDGEMRTVLVGRGEVTRKAPNPARALVAQSLAPTAASFPDLGPCAISTEGLSRRDGALAVAIHRLVLQRWLTLEYLLNRFLKRPLATLEPRLRGLLLSAAAQLLCMDRQPVHAVVDESVQLARLLVRPGSAGLVNAVLRRLGELIGPVVRGTPWSFAADRVPVPEGFVMLAEPCLPPPNQWEQHLAVVTSHPLRLIQHWAEQFGRDQTAQLCLHDITVPPTIVASEDGFCCASLSVPVVLHAIEGFAIWRGSRQQLVAFLAEDPQRRVQDPGTAKPIQKLPRDLNPRVIFDCCAGRGTKTAQLASKYADARVIATDSNPSRLEELRRRFAGHHAVRVVEPGPLARGKGATKVDLIVLDVPCSNTAVLARRPEARYRWRRSTMEALVKLQREIVSQYMPTVAGGAMILYSTCSLDNAENTEQVHWMADRFELRSISEVLTLPAGRNRTYLDGGFHALLRAPGG